MLEYLEKFNNLPAEIKAKVSSAAALAHLEDLENKYGVSLSAFIMRVMVGDLYYKNLLANLIIEFELEPEAAAALEKELKEKIFAGVADYLAAGKSSFAKPVPEVTSPFYGIKNQPAASVRPAPASALTPSAAKVGSSPGAIKPAPIAPAAPKNYLEEDEKDIPNLGSIAPEPKSPLSNKNDALLVEIIREANVSFASESLMKRFREIISSYLRGVRSKAGAREILLKEVVSGGLKMGAGEADRILAIVQKKIAGEENKFSAAPGKVSARTTGGGTSFIFNQDEIKQALSSRDGADKSKPVDFGARDLEYDLSALKKNNSAAPASEGDPEAVSLTGQSAPAPAKAAAMPEAPVLPKIETRPKPLSSAPKPSAPAPEEIPVPKPPVPAARPAEIPVPQAVSENDQKRTMAVVGNKRRMEDIKSAPQLMSPIDELAYMDLVTFRRLDQSPAKRAAKIEEKIALLEKEGIDKKIAAIKAWRFNPVSKTYLSMGEESIGGGRSIDDIIKDRKAQGLNYLTKEEFEAVMDLNNNLRF